MYTQLGAWQDEPTDITASSVLKRDIPWDTYMTARLISEKDLKNIRAYDKKQPAMQADLLQHDGPAIVASFLSVLKNVTKEETVQYVLALFKDMLSVSKGRCALFFGVVPAAELYPIFLRLLQRTDWYTQEKACEILTLLLDQRPDKKSTQLSGLVNFTPATSSSAAVSPDSAIESVYVSFVDWLSSQLRRPSNPAKSSSVAASALASLLKEAPVRTLFIKSGGVQLLGPLLRSPGGPTPQLTYDTAMAVWNLSYTSEAAKVMASTGIVSGLVEVVKCASKEKVLRVALYALKNLLQQPGHMDTIDVQVVESGLSKAVAAKMQQNYDDEDLYEVLGWTADWLEKNIHEMSSWERYKKELLSGSLDWNPMHKSEKFWRENVENFEDKDFRLLRVLLKLLEASRDSRTLSVGCYDLGQFITYFPDGRQLIMDLRGKELVMRLMMHPDPEVQKQALLCVQKILLGKDKLDFLNASTG